MNAIKYFNGAPQSPDINGADHTCENTKDRLIMEGISVD